MKKLSPFLLTALALIFYSCPISAATQSDIIINEIAWMGNENSANDEWIELKNNTSLDIKLDGWFLKTSDGKIKVHLTGKIPANGFYLLERTDDSSLPGLAADFIYKGSLSNKGQTLELLYNNGMIDRAEFNSKWPAGDNSTKQTMERTAGYKWQTSKNPGGTPKAENSEGQNQPAEINVQIKSQTAAIDQAVTNKNTKTKKNVPLQSNSLPGKENPWTLLLIAAAITIISAIIFLALKLSKKIKQ